MPETLRLGTRTSKLALWQASQVTAALQAQGFKVERVEIQSKGDEQADVPLTAFGAPGVFTDRFDQALYDDEIDLAVHSLKDYPATTPDSLTVAAHLKRDNPIDTLVLRKPLAKLDPEIPYLIATCSSRRKSQWLQRYPNSTVTDIRGNVPTRLAKLYESDWDGAIFARAGLDRLGLRPPHTIDMGWMIPAPAQAIIAAVCRSDDQRTLKALAQIDHGTTAYVASVERSFLALLGGGCEAPVGALATLRDTSVHFKGYVFHASDEQHYALDTTAERMSSVKLAERFAELMQEQISSRTNVISETSKS